MMDKNYFDHASVNLEILKKRAFNYRWAEVEEGVIPLTAADPDFPAPPQVIDALTNYIKDGYLSYTPKLGLPTFKKAISDALWRRKKEAVAPDLILPIDSAARGMAVIAKAFLNPGDEVIIFDPVDYLFAESVRAAGAIPVLFPARVVDGSIDLDGLDKLITPKTKMLGLCNAHNPLGMLYSEADLKKILDMCNAHDLWIMNDEIWSDIVYTDMPFTSILSLGAERNRKTSCQYMDFPKAMRLPD